MRHASRLKPTGKPQTARTRNSRRSERLALNRDDQRILRRQLVLELSRCEPTVSSAVDMILRRLQFKPVPGAVALIQVDGLTYPVNDLDNASRTAIHGQIRSVINSVLAEMAASIVEEIGEGKFAAIISAGPGSTLSEAELLQVGGGICRVAKAGCRRTLTVGIGTIYHEEKDLAVSYQRAREALSYQVFLGNDRLITYSDVLAPVERREGIVQPEIILIQNERKLRERIIAGDKEGAFQALDALLEAVRVQPGITPTAFKSLLLQTIVVCCRSAMRVGANVRALTAANINYAEIILETDSYPALRAFMRVLVEDVIHAALGRERTLKGDAILVAKKYIAENYAKSPSLREVANFVHLSPHYFSRLFAQENDCGFQDYLNKVRIEAAKDLLRNSPMKIRQAARHVGFKDVSHFARLFRRVEGMTPREFTRSVGQVKA